MLYPTPDRRVRGWFPIFRPVTLITLIMSPGPPWHDTWHQTPGRLRLPEECVMTSEACDDKNTLRCNVTYHPYIDLYISLQASDRCDENNTTLKGPMSVWSLSMIRSFVLSPWPLAGSRISPHSPHIKFKLKYYYLRTVFVRSKRGTYQLIDRKQPCVWFKRPFPLIAIMIIRPCPV